MFEQTLVIKLQHLRIAQSHRRSNGVCVGRDGQSDVDNSRDNYGHLWNSFLSFFILSHNFFSCPVVFLHPLGDSAF